MIPLFLKEFNNQKVQLNERESFPLDKTVVMGWTIQVIRSHPEFVNCMSNM